MIPVIDKLFHFLESLSERFNKKSKQYSEELRLEKSKKEKIKKIEYINMEIHLKHAQLSEAVTNDQLDVAKKKLKRSNTDLNIAQIKIQRLEKEKVKLQEKIVELDVINNRFEILDL